jgi:hypothetical protein
MNIGPESIPTAEVAAADVEPARSYRSVSALAVASLLFGILSAAVFLDWLLVIVPIVAILLGLRALGRIRREPEEWAGAALARAGIALAVLFTIAGYGWLLHARAKEIPHGYTAVTYRDLQADPDTPGQWVPPFALTLEGKKVFVKGYMYPGRQQADLTSFIISRDNGTCQFCMPHPRPSDLIMVQLAGDLRIDYTRQLLRIGGILHVEPEPKRGAPAGCAYRLEADYLR